MIWWIASVEVLLLLEACRRIRLLSGFAMIGLYIIACQVAYHLAQFVPVVDIAAPGQLRSHLYFNDAGLLLYFWIFLCCYAATLGLVVRKPVNDGLDDVGQSLSGNWLGVALAICGVLVLVHAAAIDWTALWYNRRYLLLSSTLGLSINNEFTALVQELALLVGVVSAFGFAASLSTGHRFMALGFAIVLGWHVVLALANSGRSAAVYLFVVAAVAAVMMRRWRWIVASGFASLALLCLLMALAGRQARAFGISVIADHMWAAIKSAPQRMLVVLGNLTQGIFVTNDGFILNPQHQERYKLLSFSPFPSVVDGFESVRRIAEIRLHTYVPMSAITEVVAFGPLYAAAAALSLVLGIRLSILAAQRGQVLLSVLTGAWLFLIFVQAGAYPMRNVFRQELIAIVALVIAMWVPRRAANPVVMAS